MILRFLLYTLSIVFALNIAAQQTNLVQEFNKLKQASQANFSNQTIQNSDFISFKSGLQAFDSSYTLAVGPSDDSSSLKITLPFDFCFFGQTKKDVYINNNGNISFDSPLGTALALNFPFPNIKVIAPFWADVDTRKRGLVWYKLTGTSLTVIWDQVGHFKYDTIRTNTFQLVITNGIDPILPQGFNVGMFYDNMQWSTGDASGGIQGFPGPNGGASAAIGMNKGDNAGFIQVGRFDQNNTDYDGPFGNNDGVGWLNSRNIYLSSCETQNIPPVFTGINLSDTMTACTGDDFNIDVTVIAPEDNQTTFLASGLGNFPGSITESSNGQVSTIKINGTPQANNAGDYDLSVGAIDDGTPTRSSLFPIHVRFGIKNQTPTIEGENRVCKTLNTPIRVVPDVFQYKWSTGSTQSSVLVPRGDYKVTVTEGFCETILRHTITNDSLIPVITGPSFVCANDSFQLVADTGYNYISYNWSSLDSTRSIRENGLTTYTVTVNEKLGCVGVGSFTVQELSQQNFNLTVSNDSACNNRPVRISAGNSFDSYDWNTGDTTASILKPAGTYTITVSLTSNSGSTCSVEDSVTIVNFTYTTASLNGDTAYCQFDSTLLSITPTFDQYRWSNQQTSNSSYYSTSGNHFVYTWNKHCIDTIRFELLEKPKPNGVISGSNFYCPGGDSAVIQTGTTFDSLLWNNGSRVPQIKVVNGTYFVDVWKDGCLANANHIVETMNGKIPLFGDTALCPGLNATLDAGNNFNSYDWSNGDTTQSITVPLGSYVVTVTLGTCVAKSDTIKIVEKALKTLDIIGGPSLCDGKSVLLRTSEPFNSYDWNTGSTGSIIIADTVGLYKITVLDAGCTLSDSIQLNQGVSPKPKILGDLFYCYFDSTTLSVAALPGWQTSWSNGDTNSSTTIAQPEISLIVIDSLGCVGKDGPYNVINSLPSGVVSGDTIACQNDTIRVNVKTNFLIEWFDGATDTTILTQVLTPWVRIYDTLGCADTVNHFVRVKPSIQPDFNFSPEIANSGEPIVFTDLTNQDSIKVASWLWEFGNGATSTSQNTKYAYPEGGFYSIRLAVTSDSGCVRDVFKRIQIRGEIKANNILTPNGDGINDYLVFPGLEGTINNELIIYNRWGVQVYRNGNYRNEWDAYEIEDGTYFYIMNLGESNKTVKGSFTILGSDY